MRRVTVALVALLIVPTVSALPADLLAPVQWGPEAVRAPAAWRIDPGDERVVVAVVDTGADLAHADLATGYWRGNLEHGTSTARPFGVFEELPTGPHETTQDTQGHGTQVAGIVAARHGNHVGISGMANVSLMVVKAWGTGAPGRVEAVADGIRWAADHGADVVTVSAEADDVPVLRAAVRDAHCRDVLIVAAAGNGEWDAPAYPAAYPPVVAVGAVDEDIRRWPRSNRGVDLAAPGVDVWTTTLENGYGRATGTSFAASYVAGGAGLIYSVNPALTSVDASRILNATARDLGPPGVDPGTGHGLLDAASAVSAARTATPSPPPCTSAGSS